ncbi:hypothetical protein BGX38DRAFT_105459 [Terfezia claveryi]|nr:hypothetical protein BGX38DRAFT_105459 [Terfezia claveryi]
METGWPVVKRALVLLDQTTHDYALYDTIVHLLSPPNHPNIVAMLTQDTIDAIRWISAVTKFTRLLLFYRYVSGGEPLLKYPNGHRLSVAYVLEQIRAWILSGRLRPFDKEFHTFEVTERRAGKLLNPQRLEGRGIPGQTSEYFKRRMREFDAGVLATTTGGYVATEVIYDIFVRRCSLKEGSRIHWALTKQVMKWHNAIRTDLLEIGKVRPENCGRKYADGEGMDWKTKGGWRLKWLLPGDIFFPPDYGWRKVKPQAVCEPKRLTKIGFASTARGMVHQYVDYETVMANGCKLVTESRCPICVCDWESTDMISKLQCGHVFHSECLITWALPRALGNSFVKPTCPMCRAPQTMERTFHPDTIPFRQPGNRGTGWCWAGNNLFRHSPEHYFLNKQPYKVNKLIHTTLQMWLYVREIYNHGRRHCWAIRELEWAPNVEIRPYGGALILADVSDCDSLLDNMDSRSFSDESLEDEETKFRWGDYGWGGITTEYLRELGAEESEVQRIVEFHPGLAPRIHNEAGRLPVSLDIDRWMELIDGSQGGGL